MISPVPGDVIALDLGAGRVNVQQVVSVTGYGVTMRSRDGVTELHPVTQHTSQDDVMRRWRYATVDEESAYGMGVGN